MKTEPTHDLENLYYKLVQLRDVIKDDLQSEFKKISNSVLELSETTKRFIAHFDDFKKLKEEARHEIRTTIETSSEEMARASSKTFEELINQKLQASITQLSTATLQTENALNSSYKALSRKNFYIALVFCLSSLLTSAGFAWYIQGKESLSYPKEYDSTYKLGLTFKQIWPKLSQREKSRIKELMT